MTYVELGDLAESVRPNGKMSTNVVACGIDYINNHTDVCADKIIMHYSVTCKIWGGDFHHKILRNNFAQHGDFKLTLKKYVSTPFLSAPFFHMAWFFARTCTCVCVAEVFMWQQLPCTLTSWFFVSPCKLWGNLIIKYMAHFVHTMDGNFLSTTPTHNQTFYVILIFLSLCCSFMWTLYLIFSLF